MYFLLWICSYLLFLLNADEECKRNFSVRKNSIILTKSSQSKGASFIHKQVVKVFSDCYSLCCSNSECTVAVYENKVNHICFMFNCKEPNVCLFTEHEHYISMLNIPQEQIDKNPPKEQSKQSKTGSNVIGRPSMDAALGETCGVMRKCGPANSMCTSGTCICQLGYIGKADLCVRSLCPKPELMFQCVDVSKSPFCIALYDQCNGIAECGDSSDEVNCEPNPFRRPIFNESSKSHPSNKQVKDNSISQHRDSNAQSTLEYHESHYKKPSNTPKLNRSSEYKSLRKDKYYQNKNLRKNSPQAENQLLLLEAKNKLPKYPRRNNNERSKSRQVYRNAVTPPENNPLYEKHQYSKFKMSSYPQVNKGNEYYQKGAPDQADINRRWNNLDSTANDYEYPQMSSNSRDSGSDYDTDQYSEPKYSESPGKYSSDRNYIYYPDEDEESYSKPRGRYISDNDRYPSNNGYEQSMDYNGRRKSIQNKNHRIFVNIPNKVNKAIHLSTIVSSGKNINEGISEDIGNRNMNEWSTAVVVLSLGLLLTAGLLIAVGFKMRSWRRRLRGSKKGQSLTTDEGDYLINGMYL